MALTRRFRAVDLILAGYGALVAIVALTRGYPGTTSVAVAHALVILLVWLVTWPGLGPVGRTLREIYPIVLLVGLYSALDVLSGGGAGGNHDPLVQRWELALFGEQLSRTWWQRMPSSFWSTLLHASYFAYYVILVVPALWFAWRRDAVALRRFVFMVMTTFVICYLFFIFLPVAGPYYEFPRPAAWFTDNWAARLVYQTLASGSSYGAAFPSSHVAATVAAMGAAARGSPRAGQVLAVPTALLTIAVVYCQMHYAVDALAGLAVGAAVAIGTFEYERRAGSRRAA
jgi:membrane-associated phospholipid phosphatase